MSSLLRGADLGKPRKKEGTLDGLRLMYGPVSRNFPGPPPIIMAGTDKGSRDNHAWREADVCKFNATAVWAIGTEEALMNVVETLNEQYQQAEKIWTTYKERLDLFRSQVKNDCASLEAQGRKTVEANEKMIRSFNAVVSTLTSAEMREAVENAERLASALAALNGLRPHKIMFATVDSAEHGSHKE